MKNTITNLLTQLRLGPEQRFGRLTIRPILSDSDFSVPFLTLEEALEKRVLEITEKNDAGQVSELRVFNRGNEDVILIEGEELIGAKQNRIVNTTTIVPAESEILLPVTCVERGRWKANSRAFSAAQASAGVSMRRAAHESVAQSLFSVERAESDQAAVWREVSEKSERMAIESETEASSDLSDAILKQVAPNFLDEDIRHLPRQIGFMAYIDDGLAVCDIFGTPELCEKKLGKFARSFYIDAVDEGAVYPKINEEDLLEELFCASSTEYPTAGKGTEIRFENKRIRGACKLDGENIPHLTVFGK